MQLAGRAGRRAAAVATGDGWPRGSGVRTRHEPAHTATVSPDNGLGLTPPPMGQYNTWNDFRCDINASDIMAAAGAAGPEADGQGLQIYYVNIRRLGKAAHSVQCAVV